MNRRSGRFARLNWRPLFTWAHDKYYTTWYGEQQGRQLLLFKKEQKAEVELDLEAQVQTLAAKNVAKKKSLSPGGP